LTVASQKLLNGLPGVFVQAALTEGIAGSRVSRLFFSKNLLSQFMQVMQERLVNVMADQRFRSKMAQVATACAMDGFESYAD
jgi:hypothetical protein